MKAAFIVDIGDGSEVEEMKLALELITKGTVEVVSSFGITLDGSRMIVAHSSGLAHRGTTEGEPSSKKLSRTSSR
jgi:hypothetical protein